MDTLVSCSELIKAILVMDNVGCMQVSGRSIAFNIRVAFMFYNEFLSFQVVLLSSSSSMGKSGLSSNVIIKLF